jgi:hypothetical protein
MLFGILNPLSAVLIYLYVVYLILMSVAKGIYVESLVDQQIRNWKEYEGNSYGLI